jgi:hypothetical protein
MKRTNQMKKSLALFVLAILAAGFLVASSASATTLFVGGEDSDFINLNGAAASTTAGTFSSSFARESVGVYSATCELTNVPPASYFMTPTFTASSILWIHANYYNGGDCASQSAADILRVYSPDGYPRIAINEPASTSFGQFTIYTINQAGTYTSLASMTTACFTPGRLIPLDLYINYSSGGGVTLYCNGVQVASYTGNVTTNSATQLNQVQFSGQISQSTSYWSEIIVSTTNTLSQRVAKLTPAANGNTDTWDVGGVSNINETTLSTSNPNASGTAGELQEYTIGTSTLPSGSYSVVGVYLNAYTQVDTTGPQHLQGVVRTGGTDYTSVNYSPTQSAWGVISIPFLTNPATANAWALSDLTNVNFNIGFESQN